MQYQLSTDDLALILGLARNQTLLRAANSLGVDGSTVFRSLQRIEKGLGHRIFQRTRKGYVATELGQRLLPHAQGVEASLQAARVATQSAAEVGGIVRISAVDAVLNYLLLPQLSALREQHPLLRFELHSGNDLVDLSRRDTDLAVRSTQNPPPHLIGKRLGTQRFAVFAQRRFAQRVLAGAGQLPVPALQDLPWIGIDGAMPEHPGVLWRRRVLPAVTPVIQVSSMLSAVAAIEAGMGIGVVALFHARHLPELAAITPPLRDCSIGLWLLTHPEARHLRHIALVTRYIGGHSRLSDLV